MAQCGYCGTTIVFGGVRDGAQRFCNDKCHQNASLMSLAGQVPANLVEQQIQEVHEGSCPKCRGRGPVDVYRTYRVWSAFVLTSWSATPQLCCRSCARRSQLGGVLFCLVLGWWGIPWGLILTPIQIIRNIAGMCTGPDPRRPSAELEKFVKVTLAAQIMEAAQQRGASQPPLVPTR